MGSKMLYIRAFNFKIRYKYITEIYYDKLIHDKAYILYVYVQNIGLIMY